MVAKLEHAGFSIKDLGDIDCRDRQKLDPGNPRMHYLDEIIRVNQLIAESTEMVIKNREKIVVIGGDHSIDLGAVSGASVALGGNLALIYIDAHGDMNTDETTLTGNIHGMHVASLLGFGASELKDLHGPNIKIDKNNFLHIGGSDFDQAEIELVNQQKLNTFTLLDLLKNGMAPLLDKIDELSSRIPNVWVSLDLDSIDQIYAPGAGMPNAKGLTYREIATIAEYIGINCSVVGLDVVEYNPLQDQDYKTAELAIELTAKFFGKNYNWYTNYLDRNKVN
jgi:arginase